ncbi:MAG: hypothetical protein GY768_06590 [Planctomycetaceae bacterium]|nr:hypothetical protein [Planctomycetaceae bacterium]
MAAVILLNIQTHSWGHAGHGRTEASNPLHYLSEPVHLAFGIAALLVTTVFLAHWLRQHQAQRGAAKA